MAESDLTLPVTAATELSISPGDPRLPRYISVASAAVRSYLARPQLHYSAAYVDKIAGLSRARLILSLTPVRSITSVVAPDGSTVPSTEYEIDDANLGFLMRITGWPYTGRLRPGLLWSDPDMGTERKSWVITYAGGWVTPAQASSSGWSGPDRDLPHDIEEAVLQTCVGLYRRGGVDQMIAAESLGDYSVTYRTLGAGMGQGGIIPDTVLPLLQAYRGLS